jgi:type II secretory pathway pseudopilin PulG
MAAIAIVAIVSPAVLVRNLGGVRKHRALALEVFLRVAGSMLLIGAVTTWYRVWKMW